MALHHAALADARQLHGGGSYEANEGTALTAIRCRLQPDLAKSPPLGERGLERLCQLRSAPAADSFIDA